jgi:hypothetical protein
MRRPVLALRQIEVLDLEIHVQMAGGEQHFRAV